MLTPRQHECLTFILRWTEVHGASPSYRDIGAGMGIASTNSVHRLICALEERGFIRRLPHQSRAFEVIRQPGEVASMDAAAARDAARYRWLRSRDLDTIHEGGVFAGLTPENVVINGADLDRYVDAAIAAESRHG